MEGEELYSPVDELEVIHAMLKSASKHGLTAEAVLSALTAIKEDPTLYPVQAMRVGLLEWDI